MDRNDIIDNFNGCVHCSQTVVEQWADKLGIEGHFHENCRPFGGRLL